MHTRWRSNAVAALTCAVGLAIMPMVAAAAPGSGAETSSEPRSPMRIVQANNGDLLVSDYYGKQIITYAKGDTSAGVGFPVEGKPLAVAIEGGRVYVGNDTTHRVEVYSRRGRYRYDLGGADGRFQQPADMAIDEGAGLVFVADGMAGVVKVFNISVDSAGVLERTIPSEVPNPSLLVKPTGIAVDVTRQEVLVADYGDTENGIYPRVQIFDYNGTLLSSISGRAGMMGNRFSRPQGVAVNSEGQIFMVASWLGRVMIFDRETGALLGSLGTYGTDPGQLQLPLDIIMNAETNDVFVTNNRPRRVEVYVGGGVLP